MKHPSKKLLSTSIEEVSCNTALEVHSTYPIESQSNILSIEQQHHSGQNVKILSRNHEQDVLSYSSYRLIHRKKKSYFMKKNWYVHY